jgi:hypothetical protein
MDKASAQMLMFMISVTLARHRAHWLAGEPELREHIALALVWGQRR